MIGVTIERVRGDNKEQRGLQTTKLQYNTKMKSKVASRKALEKELGKMSFAVSRHLFNQNFKKFLSSSFSTYQLLWLARTFACIPMLVQYTINGEGSHVRTASPKTLKNTTDN